MAINLNITEAGEWYQRPGLTPEGAVRDTALKKPGEVLMDLFRDYKSEMEKRTQNYDNLAKLADAEVITKHDDLANVSSGEASGAVLRMARNLVQHTPNMQIHSKFDSDNAIGYLLEHILKARVIGDEFYSNDMQQNLFATAKNSLTFGFDCVIPIMKQDRSGTWNIQYDNIFYGDVFPDPGVKDIRSAANVFIRRYLTKGDVHRLLADLPAGWEGAGLKTILCNEPANRRPQSVDQQAAKHKTIPKGYEVITWYSDSGDNFLTFTPEGVLLRIEKNKHPLKEHPVHFLVLEKDLNQPLGKSQVERILGRQEFQDLLLNGAMKAWYKELNPPIVGYGISNSVVNMSPGKLTRIGNPNGKLEQFNSSSQTLMQFGSISQQNAGNMIQQIGAADQQMAAQNTGGMMSQTPQGVEAQQAMVDITTNNYQKAIESFFSHYCSYALTLYFHELSGAPSITPPAEVREKMLANGLDENLVDEDGTLKMPVKDLAVLYHVQAVPGSLVEMEQEKQLRILNEMFIPLSQAMPAIAAAQDEAALRRMSSAMQFIVQKQLELSGSMHKQELKDLMEYGQTEAQEQRALELTALSDQINLVTTQSADATARYEEIIANQQEQISLLTETQGEILKKLGVSPEGSAPEEPQTGV